MKKALNLELKLWKRYPVITGLDEAGRGALAGPLVVAAVTLPVNFQSPFIQDSKILTPQQRNQAYQIIKKNLVEYKVIFKSPREIEVKNPLGATKEAMVEAILSLTKKPDLGLVDGREKITIKGIKTRSIIGGDRKSINIAAASIMAKVIRDSIMRKLHLKHPHYDWFNNKGYPNKTHLTALFHYGVCHFHRRTYEPIKSLLNPKIPKAKVKKKYNLN